MQCLLVSALLTCTCPAGQTLLPGSSGSSPTFPKLGFICRTDWFTLLCLPQTLFVLELSLKMGKHKIKASIKQIVILRAVFFFFKEVIGVGCICFLELL